MNRGVLIIGSLFATTAFSATAHAGGNDFVFTGDNNGAIQFELPAQDQVAHDGTPAERFGRALLKFLNRSRALVCSMPVLPKKVGFSFGDAELQWTEKVLCADLNTEPMILADADPNSRTPKIAFKLPRRLENIAGLTDPAQRLERQMARSEFANNVTDFFCDFPVRPETLKLKVSPVKIEWSLSLACDKL